MAWYTRHRVKGAVTPPKINDILKEVDAGGIELPVFTVAQLNTAGVAEKYENRVVICSNGNAGARCLALSDGETWERIVLGADIATT